MGSLSLLVFFAQFLIASSLVEFQGNELQHKQAGLHFNIYHGQELHSSFMSKSSFFSDMLAKDEERVKALYSKLAGDVFMSTTPNASEGREKVVGIPLKSGLPIGTGNYYVKVGLGTPVKYYTMVVDTGSSLSWLQCQPCVVSCHPQIDPLFNPSNSKTYKKISCLNPLCSSLKDSTLNDPICETSSKTCVYRASYGDSSYSIGYLSQDTLALSQSQTLPGFVYGCGQENEGLFGRTAGMIGLAHDKLSMLAQLSTKYGYVFSYCLPTSFSASASTSTGGFLSIGNSSLATSSYKFTPMMKDSKNPSLYYLNLATITVAGKPLGVAASSYKVPTIIDSGTVITRLPVSLYTALKEAFVKIMSKKYAQVEGYSILDTCFKGSAKNMLVVPEIQMNFPGGANLLLKANNVLLETEKGITCLAFAGSSDNPIAIIGNFQQQRFNVAYDISNSRIGFAAGGCN
ncbi:Aspartyl protease family protein [Quillaja saponaria]|uniref:Aspartyl protease family protein n=1 Tax=Quillaja saponaria TaxID=32244 RepID=A0AAD7M179_QUISA|nr:Aspartyl protease family protein [Quillaja saponaria]